VLSKHDVEALRRSHAMAPLAPSQVSELLDTCTRLICQHEAAVAAVQELPPTFAALRTALNALHRILSTPEA
jgi:hypothetical protein